LSVRIRAVTLGMNIDDVYNEHEKAAILYKSLSERFASMGFPVDTQRMVFSPLELSPSTDNIANYLSKIEIYDKIFADIGVRWFCQPVSLSDELILSEFYTMIPKMISCFPKYFLHFLINNNTEFQADSLIGVAKTIIDISRMSSTGFDNFRVGVGCNIRPNTPFFPFSFHEGTNGFSVAVDVIALCVDVIDKHSKVGKTSDIIEMLVSVVSEELQKIEKICRETEELIPDYVYKGMDCSLAPYPQGKRSIAYLLEQIAPHICGDPGTLTATSLLTKMLRTALVNAKATKAGFNGVMFSPLEDGYLAKYLGRSVNIEKLMLYSTVCGCGIDMCPLTGLIMPEELASLIQDILTLSNVHNKPLGVRVLPIPAKMVNDKTEFNHDFLVNCRVLSIEGQGLLKDKIGNHLWEMK